MSFIYDKLYPHFVFQYVLHFVMQACKIGSDTRGVEDAAYKKEDIQMSEKVQQEFPAYYTALCARVADAIDALEQQNYGAARDVLISGMQEAEEIILTQVDGSPAK